MNEAAPPPPQLNEILREKDTRRIAIAIFECLEKLRPELVPEPQPFPDQELLKGWRSGQAEIPDHLVGAFAAWLINAQQRSRAISENERRLRATLWAHVQLRYVADYGAHFADWHKRYWGIAVVPDPYNEREALVKDRARSAKPWGHK